LPPRPATLSLPGPHPLSSMPVELWLECAGADAALELRAVGGCPALGNWDPSRGAALERCTGGGEPRWQLAGGPLLLAKEPESLGRCLEYRYAALLPQAEGGQWEWEDLGSVEVPLFSGGGGPAGKRRFAGRRLSRCLLVPCHSHAILARCDRWGNAEEACEEAAWPAQAAWSVEADFAPGLAGGGWAVGLHYCKASKGPQALLPGDGAPAGTAEAEWLFVHERRARLLRSLRQLSRQAAERDLAPRHLWIHIGAFLGEATVFNDL